MSLRSGEAKVPRFGECHPLVGPNGGGGVGTFRVRRKGGFSLLGKAPGN